MAKVAPPLKYRLSASSEGMNLLTPCLLQNIEIKKVDNKS